MHTTVVDEETGTSEEVTTVNGYASNDLIHTDETHLISSIPKSNTAITSSSFYDNTWGYSLDATNYYAIPLASSPKIIKTTTQPGQVSTVTTIGINTTSTVAAGTYHDILTFTAIPNYKARTLSTKTTLADIDTMQEMTAEICNNTPTPTSTNDTITYYLIDTRGGGYDNNDTIFNDGLGNQKTYAVAKMADGNCWMQQNLNLTADNLSTGVSAMLTNANSNVAEDSTYQIPSSTDPSEITWPGSGTSEVNLVYDQNTTISGLPYGALYTWYAATAGTGMDSLSTGEDAESSVCPKGWQLPTVAGGAAIDSQSDLGKSDVKSYYNLIKAEYNVGNTSLPDLNTITGNSRITSAPSGVLEQLYTGDYTEALSSTPFYLPLSGMIWSVLKFQGARGVYTTSTASGNGNMYSFYVLSDWVGIPEKMQNKKMGLTVRCVSEQVFKVSIVFSKNLFQTDKNYFNHGSFAPWDARAKRGTVQSGADPTDWNNFYQT